jgi:hypothetical protein
MMRGVGLRGRRIGFVNVGFIVRRRGRIESERKGAMTLEVRGWEWEVERWLRCRGGRHTRLRCDRKILYQEWP